MSENIINDEFGYGFMLYNGWLVFSLYLVIVQALPIWRNVQKILVFPVNIRVRLGSKINLHFSHIALFVNAVFIIVLYLTIQSYQKPAVAETPVIKNIRLSKKWQHEAYIWQCSISFVCWLYTISFGSVNDRKTILENEIKELEKKEVKQERNSKSHEQTNTLKNKEKGASKSYDKSNETRRPVEEADKKND